MEQIVCETDEVAITLCYKRMYWFVGIKEALPSSLYDRSR